MFSRIQKGGHILQVIVSPEHIVVLHTMRLLLRDLQIPAEVRHQVVVPIADPAVDHVLPVLLEVVVLQEEAIAAVAAIAEVAAILVAAAEAHLDLPLLLLLLLVVAQVGVLEVVVLLEEVEGHIHQVADVN